MTYNGPIWEGVYQSFDEVPSAGEGFDGSKWISNSLERITALREETEKNAPLPPMGNYRESLLPLLAALVYCENKRLRVLDFGGGIGFTYYQTMQALPQTKNAEYHVVEREPVCKAGQDFFGDTTKNLFFHTELPKEEGLFDIVYSSSALQYIEDWKNLVTLLCKLSSKYLLLVDVFAGNNPSFASAQHYYASRIPMWFLNFDDLVQVVNLSGYEMVYKSAFYPTIHGTEQSLPMQNFDEKYRLRQACNLLLEKQRV